MNVVEYKNLRFTVLNVEDRRIGKVKIEILLSKRKKRTEDDSKREGRLVRRAPREKEKIKKKLNNIKGLSKCAQPSIY